MNVNYVIIDRDVGALSERFESRQDAERAIRFFRPGLLGRRFQILEASRVRGRWVIADPDAPPGQMFSLPNKPPFMYEEDDGQSHL